MKNFGLFLTGYKGLLFLMKLKKLPDFVVTYDNKERMDSEHYQKILKWCSQNEVKCIDRKGVNDSIIDSVDIIFVIGWQYLIKNNLDKLIVFHDSYLPERRGFSPTVSSLLDSSEYIGASCFLPKHSLTNEPDYGIVYLRKKKMITHPITLKKAFEFISDLYIEMFDQFLNGSPVEIPIDYDISSFSVWGDEHDLRIDWSLPISKIYQKVSALSYPYDGATSMYRNDIIHIEKISIESNLNIVNRHNHLGKTWKIINNCPLVICSDGILKINKAKTTDNEPVSFKYLRSRFK